MADFIAPRRARLKRRKSDVLGVSYEEQRLIEKALKESLKDKQSQIDSDDDSDMSCPSGRLVGGSNSYKNVAKKSAINDKPWMELKAAPKMQSKRRHRPVKYSKDDSQGDPVYKPHATGCASSLPPKPSFERHSKAITNFMLDLSTETDDEDSLLTAFSSGTQSPYSSEEEKVIVISDSSTDNEDTSDDDSSSSSSCSSSLNLDSKFQSKSIALGKMVSPAKGAFKTQKILFKAVKKSSSKAPLAVFSPRVNTALKSAIVSPKPANLATRKQPSKFARPKAMLKKKSLTEEKTKPQPISPKNSLFSSAMLESSISSWTSSDESEDYSQPTLSKDTDKSLFQAQRKFAGYLNPSNQCNDLQSCLADVETTCNVPSTEDFVLFLCLRNSGRMPESLHVFNTPCIHPRVTKQRISGICIQ